MRALTLIAVKKNKTSFVVRNGLSSLRKKLERKKDSGVAVPTKEGGSWY